MRNNAISYDLCASLESSRIQWGIMQSHMTSVPAWSHQGYNEEWCSLVWPLCQPRVIKDTMRNDPILYDLCASLKSSRVQWGMMQSWMTSVPALIIKSTARNDAISYDLWANFKSSRVQWGMMQSRLTSEPATSHQRYNEEWCNLVWPLSQPQVIKGTMLNDAINPHNLVPTKPCLDTIHYNWFSWSFLTVMLHIALRRLQREFDIATESRLTPHHLLSCLVCL